MQFLVDILKSRGKVGGVGLILLGIGHGVLAYLGQIQESLTESATIVLLGLGILGIRSKMDKTKV